MTWSKSHVHSKNMHLNVICANLSLLHCGFNNTIGIYSGMKSRLKYRSSHPVQNDAHSASFGSQRQTVHTFSPNIFITNKQNKCIHRAPSPRHHRQWHFVAVAHPRPQTSLPACSHRRFRQSWEQGST